MKTGVITAIIIALVVISSGAGYGAGSLLGATTKTMTSTTTQTAVSTTTQKVVSTSTVVQTTTIQTEGGPYILTLVVTMDNRFNRTVGDQPAFYVLGPNGLQPATNISLPAHRLIKLMIINYDPDNATLTDQRYAKVTGTKNNTMIMVSNDIVNSSYSSKSAIVISGPPQTVSSLPVGQVSHTLTVPALGLNVPFLPTSTVITYLTVDKPGVYTWYCFTLCGSGSDGKGGAMAAVGWMVGSFTVG